MHMDLFVCFCEPFWVALVLVDDGPRTVVYRHVFGSGEPTNAEVVAFAGVTLHALVAGRPAGMIPALDRHLPATRAARLRVARDAVAIPVVDSEMLDALAERRVIDRHDARAARRRAAEADQDRRHDLARARARDHHRHG
jgi:hypothetical protein